MRPLVPQDIPAIAALHRVTFSHAAVSQLGQGTVERYYRSILSDAKEGLALGTFCENRLAAFCIAGVWDEPEKEFLRRNLPFVATRLLAAPWLFFQPFIWERIRTGIGMLVRRSPQPAAVPTAPTSPSIGTNDLPVQHAAAVRSLGILYIGVHPNFRGRGFARQLLRRVENFARENRFPQLDLSVYLDNTPAIELYLSDGWEKRLSGSVWKGFMIKRL